MNQAMRSTRQRGYVGYVGVPQGVKLDGAELFYACVYLHGVRWSSAHTFSELLTLLRYMGDASVEDAQRR